MLTWDWVSFNQVLTSSPRGTFDIAGPFWNPNEIGIIGSWKTIVWERGIVNCGVDVVVVGVV